MIEVAARRATLRALTRVAVMAGVALTSLSGCTASAVGPQAGTQFDGVYSGASILVHGFGYVCDPPRYDVSIPVKGGRFDYAHWVSPLVNRPVRVQVLADGALAGQAPYQAESYFQRGSDFGFVSAWIRIEGKISGPELEATVSDYRCTRHLTLQRQ